MILKKQFHNKVQTGTGSPWNSGKLQRSLRRHNWIVTTENHTSEQRKISAIHCAFLVHNWIVYVKAGQLRRTSKPF